MRDDNIITDSTLSEIRWVIENNTCNDIETVLYLIRDDLMDNLRYQANG